nr:hypothetical protein [uncultured Holophaga sp.]
MEWLIPTIVIAIVVGLNALIIKLDKSTIRKEITAKGYLLIDIKTSLNLLLRSFKYQVTFKTQDGTETQENCRVSFFLGVVWEDEDSFLKWLLP